MPNLYIAVVLTVGCFLFGWQPGGTRALAEPPADLLRLAVAETCGGTELHGLNAQLSIPGAWLLSDTRRPDTGPTASQRVVLAVDAGDEVHLEARYRAGQIRQFRASYFAKTSDGSLRPALLAMAQPSPQGACDIQAGRRIRHEGPAWRYLDQLEPDLRTLRWTETLQAPWPLGADPGGVRVGLIDSGLAYDLELFRNRLARDGTGTPIGYDYWDMDPFPYDGDVSRGPFFPIRHGTSVASVLAMEAPDAALVPYRYPRPDMSRLGGLVRRADADGVRILAMPLGSNRPDDWTAFVEALAETDILAVVSAGNNGRNIDETPVWPAALGLDTILVVTSSDVRGRVAPGSNWGPDTVDVMVPAENVPVVDFRGAQGVTSGTSFAVPRVAALAARLLDQDPTLGALELKVSILERAIPSPFAETQQVGAGWIPDPTTD